MKLFTKNNIAHFLIIVFFLALFLKNYLGAESSRAVKIMSAVMMLIGIVATLFLFFSKFSVIPRSLYVITILLFISSLFISIFSSNYRIEDNLLAFVYWGLAAIPLFYKLNYKVFLAIAYTQIAFFIYYIIQGLMPQSIFMVSRNFISVLLLITIGYHYISAFQNQKNPNILLIIISFFIAVWASGRSGIIVFSLLLLTFPIVSKLSVFKKTLAVSIIFIAVIFSYEYFSETLFKTSIDKIMIDRFQDRGRESANTEYLNAVLKSFPNLLGGVDLGSLPSMRSLDLNPHNSFIRLHVYYGIVGIVIVFILIINSIWKFLKNKNYMYLIFFIALLIRISVDSAAFHGPLDILIFYFLFYGLNFKKSLLNSY